MSPSRRSARGRHCQHGRNSPRLERSDGRSRAPLFGHTDFVRTSSSRPTVMSVVIVERRRHGSNMGAERTASGDVRRTLRRLGDAASPRTVRWWRPSPRTAPFAYGMPATAADLVEAKTDPPSDPTTERRARTVRRPRRSTDRTVILTRARSRARGARRPRAGGHERRRSPATAGGSSAAGRDRDVILWDVAHGTALRRLRGHFGEVRTPGSAPTARWIVTPGRGPVGLWARRTAGDRLLFGPRRSVHGGGVPGRLADDLARTEDGTVGVYDCRDLRRYRGAARAG